jgi:O-phosphoseryl-tRNA synthetase
VEEPESGSRLLGPAGLNRIYAHNGSLLGIPDTDKWKEVRESGVDCGITYLSSVAALAASRIEQAARCGQPVTIQVKMAKLPSDVNIRVEDYAMRFITDRKKKIDLRGPVFLTVRSELER